MLRSSIRVVSESSTTRTGSRAGRRRRPRCRSAAPRSASATSPCGSSTSRGLPSRSSDTPPITARPGPARGSGRTTSVEVPASRSTPTATCHRRRPTTTATPGPPVSGAAAPAYSARASGRNGTAWPVVRHPAGRGGRGRLLGSSAHAGAHRVERHRRHGAGGLDHQAVQRQQRQRHDQFDGGATAGFGAYRHVAAELIGDVADHVQADAAAGHLGHRGRGADPAAQDQVQQLCSSSVGAARHQQAARLRGTPHRRQVEAAPVVAAAEGRVPPAALDLDDHPALGGLAGRPPLASGLSMPCATALRTTCSKRPADQGRARAGPAAVRRRGPRSATRLPWASAASRTARCSAVKIAATRPPVAAARPGRGPGRAHARPARRCRRGGGARRAEVGGQPGGGGPGRVQRIRCGRSAAARPAGRRRGAAGPARALPRRSGANRACASPIASSRSSTSAGRGARGGADSAGAACECLAGAPGFRRGPGRARPSLASASGSRAATRCSISSFRRSSSRISSAGSGAASVAVRHQHLLERVRRVGDLGLPHHPGRALERVREPQQPGHQIGPGLLVQLQHARRELVDQLARLDPEVPQRVAGHQRAARCRPARAGHPTGRPAATAVCRVCPALASVSRVARAMSTTATLTCSTAVVCCLVDSSISRAASVVVATSCGDLPERAGARRRTGGPRRRPPSSRSRWPSPWC